MATCVCSPAPTQSKDRCPKLTTTIFRLTLLAYVMTLVVQTVHTSPTGAGPVSTPVNNFHVDLTASTSLQSDGCSRGLVSFVARGFELPGCGSSRRLPGYNRGDAPDHALCPWEVVEDEDPLRIPRKISQARCKCIHCRVNQTAYGEQGKPLCKENHVTIPVVRCDKDPDVSAPNECRMGLQRIVDSCVCTRPVDQRNR